MDNIYKKLRRSTLFFRMRGWQCNVYYLCVVYMKQVTQETLGLDAAIRNLEDVRNKKIRNSPGILFPRLAITLMAT
jgi:hypothetical protein